MYRILIYISLILLSAPALPWSAAGHTIVCQIAYNELTTTAKAAVDSLVALETNERFQTFGESCVWPDTPPRARSSDHYYNVPRYWTHIGVTYCPIADTCLTTAIQSDIAVIRDESSTQLEKWIALKYLGHWLGDIHQPLHISYADDRGGNYVLLERGFGCSKNLHSVWDKCIPEDLMKEANIQDRLQFGDFLHSQITSQQRQKWANEMSLSTWADESYQITRQENVQYCVLDGRSCKYDEYNYKLNDGEDKKVLDLTSDYEDEFGGTVVLRLKQAGVRLGATLNWIFDGI